MPRPVSFTEMCTTSCSVVHSSDTEPPDSVNFTEFTSRLSRICRAFSGSARIARSGRAAPVRVAQPLRVHLRPDHLLDALEQRADPDILESVLHLPRIELGEVEDVVDQAEQVLAAAADALEVRALALRQGAADAHEQQVGVARDRIERRAQLVAHRGEERALRLVRRHRLHARLLGRLRRDLELAARDAPAR